VSLVVRLKDIRDTGFEWPKYKEINQYCSSEENSVDIDRLLEKLRLDLELYERQLKDGTAFKHRSVEYFEITEKFDGPEGSRQKIIDAIEYLKQIEAFMFGDADQQLTRAVSKIEPILVKSAIARGGNVNQRDQQGNTLLHKVVVYSDNTSKPYKNWDAKQCIGAVVLGFSDEALNKHSRRLDLITTLLEAGADAELRNSDGERAIDIARRVGSNAFVELLRYYSQNRMR